MIIHSSIAVELRPPSHDDKDGYMRNFADRTLCAFREFNFFLPLIALY